eukprot:TRINITY_DN66190_c10_g6_i1.p1 TRINITY_DN66190_c10_g6~~TRINITY_DN66190_c10_g6_i1.p1  ORF type:complete len:350 (-),score=162.21 TRINITY_DN66190_c10_g6_i1:23-1024(-)
MLLTRRVTRSAAGRSALRGLGRTASGSLASFCRRQSSSRSNSGSGDSNSGSAASGGAGLSSPLKKTGVWSQLWNNEWITAEAESIIARSYRCHRALGDKSDVEHPRPTAEELESLAAPSRFPPQTIGDYIADYMVKALVPFTHLFFRDRYNHHAVTLETVAAVPGMVGGMLRHLRSLRHMRRDHGWIGPLLEEAENERMHLLVWMTVTQPTLAEKLLVMAAQGFYFAAYTIMYVVRPSVAHRFVGYLEEAAVLAYTDYLNAIDDGSLPNQPAPEIARKYWLLPESATLRDVVLHVRADEHMHMVANHNFAEMHKQGHKDKDPSYFTKMFHGDA